MIHLRSPDEIESIARAGEVVDRVIARLLAAATPGASTGDLDTLARRLLEEAGATPLFPGFVQQGAPPFPGAICACVNDEVTHGVPGERVLLAGDLLTVDLGGSVEGWCADASRACVVGDARAAADATVPREPGGDAAATESVATRRALLLAAHAVTEAAIGAMGPGRRWSEAADAAWRTARAGGWRLVAGYAGHGVGRALHETPRAPMFPGPREDFVLRPGMVLTVEPIVVAMGRVGAGAAEGAARSAAAGGRSRAGERVHAGEAPASIGVEVDVRSDGWTVATRDGADACQIEQTVAVTDRGVRVLTRS